MSSYSYSQTGYPRRIVYNGDTVIAITVHHMQSIYLAHITWQECRETQDSLIVILDSCQVAFSLYDTTIANFRKDLTLHKLSIADRDKVISTQQDIIAGKNKEIRKLKVHRAILGGFSTVLIVVLAVALIF